MSDRDLKVLGFAGSLRRGSFNRSLIGSCRELAPEGLTVDVFDIDGIPLYNADLDNDESRPEAVREFKGAIEAADGVLIASPEYNYGVPGVLKNVLDWASRPGFASPFFQKPTGIMGAAKGRSGTMRGQERLKLNLLGMGSQVFPHPGVAVSAAASKFDDGRLTDESTREFLAKYLESYAGWLARVREA